jgi:hypothetical protein
MTLSLHAWCFPEHSRKAVHVRCAVKGLMKNLIIVALIELQ